MTNCHYASRGRPRVIHGEHVNECHSGDCLGCRPCPQPHCVVCGRSHLVGACAECVAETRAALHDIGRMTGSLSGEVEHRGVNGEAMVLLGPAVDPEQLGHVQASIAAGRLPADYLDHADHELHPLFVLGKWDMTYRDALDHDEDDTVTIASAIDYLDRQLTYAAGFEHVPFEDMAADVRRCAAHLEAVLHDGEQIDRGAPCMTCHKPLERVWGADEHADGWMCRRCATESSEAQYRFAVAHHSLEHAEWLTDAQMQVRTGVRAGTVREWARRGLVEKKRDSGRTVYRVADVTKKGSAA